MSTSQELALFLIVISLWALWVNHQGKLSTILGDITAPVVAQTSGHAIGQWAIAIGVYLIITSFLPPQTTLLFTVIIILGALAYDTEHPASSGTLLTQLGI